MVLMALGALILGIIGGAFPAVSRILSPLTAYSQWILYLLMFSVGISVGLHKGILAEIRRHHIKILVIPLGIIIGSLAGGLLCGLIMHYPLNQAISVAGGLGWYSLSGVAIGNFAGVKLGSIAFLSNLIRIGLGKQKGAESIHHQSPAIMHELVEEYGRTILENAPVLGGIAIIENAYDDTYLIKGLSPEEIISEEPKLKEISYKTIAHLLFDKCDVLVVDKIGKNISGDGMDPNVSGRFVQPKYCSGGIQAEKCVILDLTDETHGNAQGIGLAEVTTRRLFNKMKLEMTYPTGVTNTFLHLMKIPMIMDNDREAMQLALMCCPEAEDHDHMKMIRIPNTAHIGVIEISEGMLPLVENNPNFEVLTEPYDLPFDENGNLF